MEHWETEDLMVCVLKSMKEEKTAVMKPMVNAPQPRYSWVLEIDMEEEVEEKK